MVEGGVLKELGRFGGKLSKKKAALGESARNGEDLPYNFGFRFYVESQSLKILLFCTSIFCRSKIECPIVFAELGFVSRIQGYKWIHGGPGLSPKP